MPRKSSLAARLRSAISTLNQRLRREDAISPIGPTGIGILGLLYRSGPANAAELAEQAHVQPQSLTRALKALENDGYLGRRTDENDRRRAILWITPKGEEFLMITMRTRVAWLRAAINRHLDDEEREKLMEATELLERLGSDGGEPQDPPEGVFNILPFLRVREVERSVQFYERLGFIVDASSRDDGALTYASMRSKIMRSGRIMFIRTSEAYDPQKQGIFLYAWTDNVATLYRHLREGGFDPSPMIYPEYMPDGEFTVADPDGYAIVIGQVRRVRSKPDAPSSNETR